MKKNIEVMLMILFLSGAAPVLSQSRDRATVPIQYTWNLQDLYASDEAWKQEKETYRRQIPALTEFKNKLTESAQLLQCLRQLSAVTKELVRLSSYASMKSDQDTRDAGYTAMKLEMAQIFTDLQTHAAFWTCFAVMRTSCRRTRKKSSRQRV